MSEKIWIEIARTGVFVDNRGHTHNFSAARLDEIAANYRNRKQSPYPEDAPLVLGHPEDNHPAFGWATALERRGERLCAQFAHVTAEAADFVRKKLYRHVSMSLHPGGRHLRHVGLLGAVPPAIKGLAPVEMSDNGDMTINFAVPGAAEKQGETMSEDLKRLGQLEEQVKSLQAQVKNLTAERDKAQAEAGANAKKAEEAAGKEATAAKEAAAVKAEFTAYRGGIEKTVRAARLEKLVDAGQVTPAEKADLLAQAEALAQISTPMEFSDGEKAAPEERFWRSLEARGKSPLLGTATPPANFSAGGAAAQAAEVDYTKKI